MYQSSPMHITQIIVTANIFILQHSLYILTYFSITFLHFFIIFHEQMQNKNHVCNFHLLLLVWLGLLVNWTVTITYMPGSLSDVDKVDKSFLRTFGRSTVNHTGKTINQASKVVKLLITKACKRAYIYL